MFTDNKVTEKSVLPTISALFFNTIISGFGRKNRLGPINNVF